MFKVVDCNNFWSPSGGGVRRYHLEKMDFYKNRSDVEYRFVMHDSETYTEQYGENAYIEHLKVPKVMGNWEYRYLIKTKPLEPILKRIEPDAIEVGSPYFLPRIVQKIVRKNDLKSKTFGFWHADFPVTYVKRFLDPMPWNLAQGGERAAWNHARKYYNRMNGTMVSSKLIQERMIRNGLQNVHFLPLGVNKELFHPGNRDMELIDQYKKGNNDRLFMFFPHRFSKEKGLDILIESYPLICEKLKLEPILVIAGMGPYEKLAIAASNTFEHVHFHGFIKEKETMAKFYASADLGFALSKWETFGLSLLESLSSGLPLIAANDGAALEHIEQSGAGIILQDHSPEGLADAVIEFAKAKQSADFPTKAISYAEKLTWESCFEKQLEIYKSA